MKNPLVSVIIATKNEEKNIGNCLESIKNQTYPKIEIIVVDLNSTDNTRKIAQGYTKVLNLAEADNLRVKNLRGAQVNFGVKKSRGDIIFFPDADMTFSPNLVSEAVELLEKYDALYVPEVICGKGFFGKIRNFERGFYNKTCIDAVRFVRRNTFLAVGGFDEKDIAFGPDDWDLTKMIKQKTRRLTITQSPIYHHEEELDFNIYLRKKAKYVPTFEDYIKKWKKDNQEMRKQLGTYYRAIGVFIENGKWLRMLMHPVLTLGMYYLRSRVGLNYWRTKR